MARTKPSMSAVAVALFISLTVSSGSSIPCAGDPVLLGSDVGGHRFSYPRVFVGASALNVGAHDASDQSAIVSFGKGKPKINRIVATNQTYPPNSALPFDDIADFDLTDSGGCAFTGSVGTHQSCADPVSDDRQLTITTRGYMPHTAPKTRAHPGAGEAQAVQGMYFARTGDRVATPVVDTHTKIPDSTITFDNVNQPSTDGRSASFYGCTHQGARGVFFRSNNSSRIQSCATSATAAPGTSDQFNDFLSTSVSKSTVAFFANVPSHLPAPRLYLGGVYVAVMSPDKEAVVTAIAQCDRNFTHFQAFGAPVVDGDMVGFVALQSAGGEAIYVSHRLNHTWSKPEAVVRAGQAAPGAGGAVFAQFPQPPSVCNGELVFRAYLSDGGTGVFFMDVDRSVSALITTNQLLLNRSIVYMGSAEHAYGGCRLGNRVVTFYASTTDAQGKDPYDGIYMMRLNTSRTLTDYYLHPKTQVPSRGTTLIL